MTNVTHKFLSTYLFLFLTVYMFRAPRAHHQERQIVSIQPLVTVTLCWWPCRLQAGSDLVRVTYYLYTAHVRPLVYSRVKRIHAVTAHVKCFELYGQLRH